MMKSVEWGDRGVEGGDEGCEMGTIVKIVAKMYRWMNKNM
jgi:hypothetical protein